MKKYLFMIIALFVAIVTSAQVVDTTNIIHTNGETIGQFFSSNWKAFAFIVWVLFSEWLYRTGKVKDGTVMSMVLNLIGKLFGKKELIKSKKPEYITRDEWVKIKGVKMLLLIFLFGSLTASLSAQSIWRPLPKAVVNEQGVLMLGSEPLTSEWHWRIDGTIIGEEIAYNKIESKWTSKPLSGMGPTIGYKHFTKQNDGTLFNDYGIAGGVLLGTDIYDFSTLSAKLVLQGSFLGSFRAGLCYTMGKSEIWKPFGVFIGGAITF